MNCVEVIKDVLFVHLSIEPERFLLRKVKKLVLLGTWNNVNNEELLCSKENRFQVKASS